MRAARLIAVAGLLAHSVVPAVRATAGSAAVQQASVAPGVAAPVPLVDAAFLDEVRARLADAFRRDDDYAYRERRTEINTNPFGRLGTGDVELYEVYPSPTPGLTYRRRLTEHGVALSDAALVRQDREYQARAAGVRPRLAADAAERAPETLEERAAAEADDIFNVLQFSVERRELFEGRPAIVVDVRAAAGRRSTDAARRLGSQIRGHGVDRRSGSGGAPCGSHVGRQHLLQLGAGRADQ